MSTASSLRTATALVSQHAQSIAFTCVLPDVWAVASSDPAKAPYVVRRTGAQFSCTCPSYQFSKTDPARCKHADAVRAEVAPVPVPESQHAPSRKMVEWCATCANRPITVGIWCDGCCPPSQRPLPVHAVPSNVRAMRHYSAEDIAALQADCDVANAKVDAMWGNAR